jgi:hypothetical protein
MWNLGTRAHGNVLVVMLVMTLMVSFVDGLCFMPGYFKDRFVE